MDNSGRRNFLITLKAVLLFNQTCSNYNCDAAIVLILLYMLDSVFAPLYRSCMLVWNFRAFDILFTVASRIDLACDVVLQNAHEL